MITSTASAARTRRAPGPDATGPCPSAPVPGAGAGVHRLVADHHAMLVGAHLGAPHPERPAQQRGVGAPGLRNRDVGAGERGARRVFGARRRTPRPALRCARGRCSCRTERCDRPWLIAGQRWCRTWAPPTCYAALARPSAARQNRSRHGQGVTMRAEDHGVTVQQKGARFVIRQRAVSWPRRLISSRQPQHSAEKPDHTPKPPSSSVPGRGLRRSSRSPRPPVDGARPQDGVYPARGQSPWSKNAAPAGQGAPPMTDAANLLGQRDLALPAAACRQPGALAAVGPGGPGRGGREPTSRSCFRSAMPPATGATSWRTNPSRTQIPPR